MIPESKKTSFFKMLQWWRLDPVEVMLQTSQYDSLPFIKSARKISSALLVFSSVVSLFIGGDDSWIGASIFAVFAVFVFMGHRWAIIASMILWTIEKGYMIYERPQSSVIQIIWWCVYMQFLYLSYTVEVERRKQQSEVPAK